MIKFLIFKFAVICHGYINDNDDGVGATGNTNSGGNGGRLLGQASVTGDIFTFYFGFSIMAQPHALRSRYQNRVKYEIQAL